MPHSNLLHLQSKRHLALQSIQCLQIKVDWLPGLLETESVELGLDVVDLLSLLLFELLLVLLGPDLDQALELAHLQLG